MTVDTTTGEIVPVDTSSAVAVTSYLEAARHWLSTAVEETGPEQIAMAKAEIATAAEATKQLNLSREIREDAIEMVRRAEYALGKSIRKGQAEGTILKQHEKRSAYNRWDGGTRDTSSSKKASPRDFAINSELNGVRGGDGIYAMSDGVDDEQFDAALEEAKEEGNLSRANVVRKVKNVHNGTEGRKQRADRIADMAGQGYTRRQIAKTIGVGENTVTAIANDYDIELAADKLLGKTARHDSNAIAENTATALEGLAAGVELIDYDDIDPEGAAELVDSLNESLRVLNRFRKTIKEKTNGC